MAKTDIKHHHCMDCYWYRSGGTCSRYSRDTAALATPECWQDEEAAKAEKEEIINDITGEPVRTSRARHLTGGRQVSAAVPLSAASQDFEGLKAIGAYLGLCTYTVSKLIASGGLPGVVRVEGNGGRVSYGISREALDAYKARKDQERASKAEAKTAPKRRPTQGTPYTLKEDEVAETTEMALYLGLSIITVQRLIKEGTLKTHRELIGGTYKNVASKADLDEAREAQAKAHAKAHAEHMARIQAKSAAAAKARRETRTAMVMPEAVIINDPRPARPHFTDQELVDELRGRGWEVTCKRIRVEEL